MSNLFQDVNGTTPVTADGQPVGLVLDRSRDGALGSELVTNGTFDTDISGWSDASATISWQSGGLLRTTLTAPFGRAYQNVAVEVGKTYVYELEAVSGTVPTAVLQISGAGSGYNSITVGGSKKQIIFTAITTSVSLQMQVQSTEAGAYIDFDNASLKEVLGTHASQPVATQRPTYNANPDRLTLDLVDDGLLVNIPVGGWDGYMVVGTDQGTASYGVSLPAGDYELGGDYFFGNTINQVLFREGAVEPAHLKAIEYVFIGDGAKESYGDVTDFSNYWREKGIIEFPLVDTSSGTNFQGTWFGNNLTSFPLIDTSSGTTFYAAWYGNNLTSFPLIDTSSGTNFQGTWTNNNLTSFPLIDTSSAFNFINAWRNNSLTSFPLLDTSSVTTFQGAWQGNNIISFPLIDTSSGTIFQGSWAYNDLTSFPLIDTSSGTNFQDAWRDNNLTEFPLLDTSSGTNFQYAWAYNSLTSFPLIDTSNVTNFGNAWQNNRLTSFPLINTSSGTNFQGSWANTPTLSDFPANMFDNCLATNFINTFLNTGLSQASIDGILVSINSNGTSNGIFTQSGGSAPSATGQSAIDAMRSRGWTITVTGGY